MLCLVSACDPLSNIITPDTDSATPKEQVEYVTLIEKNERLDSAASAERADKDFAAGNYYIVEYGEVAGIDIDKNTDSVWKQFRVRAFLGGCVVNQNGRSYSNRMIYLLDQNGTSRSDLLGALYYNPYLEQFRFEMQADSIRLADSVAESMRLKTPNH